MLELQALIQVVVVTIRSISQIALQQLVAVSARKEKEYERMDNGLMTDIYMYHIYSYLPSGY